MTSDLLTSENAIFLIVDLQERLLPKIFEFERVTANCVLLIKFAQIIGIPLLVTTQYERGLGPTVGRIKDVLSEVNSVDKVEFGCFDNERFLEQVRALGHSRNTVVLCGIESHICLTQTALGALEKGYNVHVASDATSSRTQWNWKIGLDRMRQAGAVISSTEMILYEILRRSDSTEFKAILPYLRNSSP
ncbi:MAG: hydrolase [Deltaproteobacteria bacterium]|nr:hydrolase [Deltaproteobacteria bacterium]